MERINNPAYIVALIISNIVAILFLVSAFRWPRTTRVLFFLLFAWACWMNWTTSQRTPEVYLEYAELTWSSWYSDFINGWFSNHIPLAVGFVAICQGLIAISMFLKGWIYKAGGIGAIIFLLAIAPFGLGSGFPCTITFAAAMIVLLGEGRNEYLLRKDLFIKPVH